MTAKHTAAATPATVAVPDRATTVVAALCAAMLGFFVIWGVGFSHVAALHNAGHDTRHSNAFPCH